MHIIQKDREREGAGETDDHSWWEHGPGEDKILDICPWSEGHLWSGREVGLQKDTHKCLEHTCYFLVFVLMLHLLKMLHL